MYIKENGFTLYFGIFTMALTKEQSIMYDICTAYAWNRQEILDNALKEIKARRLNISKDTFRKRLDRMLERYRRCGMNGVDVIQSHEVLSADGCSSDKALSPEQSYIEVESDDTIESALRNENVYLRKQLATTRAENNKLRTQSYIAYEVVSQLREEMKNIECDTFVLGCKKPMVGGKRLIMPISDVHYGEVVNPRAINGKNDYNTSISKARHNALFEDAISTAKINGCSVLDIPMLGDIFSGNIHDELKETNEAEITQLIIDYFKFICGAIINLKKTFSEVNIYCVVGNHSRLDQKWKSKNKQYSNYEYILYSFMKEKFDDIDGINVTISDSTVLFAQMGNMTWKLEHGDAYRGGGAFVSPWGTVTRDNFKDYMIYSEMGKKADAVIMGHWHSAGWIPMQGNNIPIIMAPSLVGPGEYSMLNLHCAYDAAGILIVTDGNDIYSQRIVKLSQIR